ncbi:hypothetical protein [Acidovorax sp. sic0104]|uniref:ParB/RepB/Spo0J family partition protein n=1 Tax=Acidovorax sp. sic0104 TaxID=2854784 RepID=UPI001C442A3C|nr:hypothetical protein [Acidovorax sp. sic0104]MBV7541939.1 hypothetical protein [Acidovorax sp. sic0104]
MANATPILRSFKAQAASDQTNVKKDDAFKIPPQDLMEEPGFNERDYNDPDVIAQIEKFAAAFIAGEFIPPVIVRIDPATGNRYVVEGHLRRKGALLAIERGFTVSYLMCIPFRGNDADRVACMINSAEGLKLNPVGIARGYLRLLNMLQDVGAVAKRVHRTNQQVEAMLVLAEASTSVQKMVSTGQVSATAAIELVRLHGDQAGEHLEQLLAQAKASGKSKVKPSAFREWVPPRKQSSAIYTSLGVLAASLKSQGVPHSILNPGEVLNTEALTGQLVQVDAGALAQLLQAFQQAEQLKAKREGGATSQEESGDKPDADQVPA